MNYNNKNTTKIYVNLYISKNNQYYLCGGAAGGGGRPFDNIV